LEQSFAETKTATQSALYVFRARRADWVKLIWQIPLAKRKELSVSVMGLKPEGPRTDRYAHCPLRPEREIARSRGRTFARITTGQKHQRRADDNSQPLCREGHESDYPSSRDGHRLVWRPAEAGEDVNFALSVALAGGARRTSRFSVVVRLGRLPPPSYLRDQGGEGDEHSRQSANGAGVHDTSLDFVLIEREPQGGYSH
jgi:hypothetical protein